MIKKLPSLLALIVVPLLFAGSVAHAAGWTLSPKDSMVAFGSVKENAAGEIHHFKGLSGTAGIDGSVSIEIDVSTVETFIGVRNERIVKWVADSAFPNVMLKARIDISALEMLKPGDTTTMGVEGTLGLDGKDTPFEASMFVARLSDKKVLASTDGMIMLSPQAAGIDAGASKLTQLAELLGITRVSPVTFRLVFKVSAKEAGAVVSTTSTALASVSSDPKKGKKIFRKCIVCHVVNKEKNRVGPHLKGVIGRKSGAVEGYRYSKAMVAAGITWTENELKDYLKNPKAKVPGTKMNFPGLRKDEDIDNVLAYIAEQSAAN